MNVEAWDAPGALPPATLPDNLSTIDVRARQVIHSNSVVVAAFQPDGFGPVFQTGTPPTPDGDKGGRPPSQSGSPPSSSQRPRTFDDIPFPPGLDGVADFDELRMDKEPLPTHTVMADLVGAVEVNASASFDAKADATFDAEVIPGPETRYAQLQARVDVLEKLLHAHPPIGPGHNNPPEAIDAAGALPTREELAPIIIAIRELGPASPQGVPPAAQQTHDRLRRFIDRALDACADETGKMGARVAVPVLAVAATLILVAIIEVAHALALWIEAVLRSAL